MELDPAHRDEVAELARSYGAPKRVDAAITPFFDPVQRPDRFGEVCMVVRRRSGKLLLAIKTFYPRGAYRLPTGGIQHGELILDALMRETAEETGLQTEVRRFVAAISYRDASAPSSPPIFHTFAFLLDEVGGTLETRDTDEQIEEWIEVDPAALGDTADRLERVTSAYSDEIGGKWSDWGRFRAIVHRVVHDELVRSSRT